MTDQRTPEIHVKPDALATMLKMGTHDLHDQAEGGEFQKRMVDGTLRREEFVTFLQQVWHVHRAIEPCFRDAAIREPRFAEMLLDSHFRTAKIEQDLRDMGAEPCQGVMPATHRFIEYVEHASKQSPLSLIGVLYVKEGATNGNKIVAKRVRDGLGLDKSVSLGYLDPHGTEQRKRWTMFKDGLNTLNMTTDEKAECVQAARATFRLFMDLSVEIAARTALALPN